MYYAKLCFLREDIIKVPIESMAGVDFMTGSRTGDVLFSPSPGEKFRKAKLTLRDSIEIETSVAMGLIRATYKAELRDLIDYSSKEETLELHLRTASGSTQTWLIKTPQIEDWISLLRSLGAHEKTAVEQAPEEKTQLPKEQVQGVTMSFKAKLALSPGRWMPVNIRLTNESFQIETIELFGMMPRSTKVAVEIKALKSFSRSNSELIKLQIESKPGYGLGEEWYITTKQRDELAKALLSLGVMEVQKSD